MPEGIAMAAAPAMLVFIKSLLFILFELLVKRLGSINVYIVS